MLLRVLGPLLVEGEGGPVSVGGPVPRRVLVALLVRPGAVVSVDRLVDAAWGEHPPPSAERTLVSHITRLRDALTRIAPVEMWRSSARTAVTASRWSRTRWTRTGSRKPSGMHQRR